MKKYFFYSAIFCFLLVTFNLSAKDTLQNIPGQYELQNVMEMAGVLQLNADHSYLAAFSYGAADWIEEGKWSFENPTVILSKSHFKTKNTMELDLFLPSGTRFIMQNGKLTATGPTGKSVVFLDPNKTPSKQNSTGEPGEGRMLVHGKVLKLDDKILMVKMEECMTFDVNRVSSEVLRNVKVSKSLKAEIPYSAIISSESCP